MSSWLEANGAMKKEFKFSDFVEALKFVNKIGELAESANHHPDIEFGWGYVSVSLSTHDEKQVTDRDRRLAEQIDRI